MKTKTISQIISIFLDHITFDDIQIDPEIGELFSHLQQKQTAWGEHSLYTPQGRILELLEKHCPQCLNTKVQ